MKTRLLLVASVVCAVGCQTTQEKPASAVPTVQDEPAPRPDVEAEEPVFDEATRMAFVDGKTGKVMTFEEVQARVTAAQAVLVGEQHDQLPHHRLQAEIIRTVGGIGKPMAVGLEMVTWPGQAALDRYGRGEIDEDGLFSALDWKESWGHDEDLYRDIFTAGRQAEATFVALNAPRDLVRAVAKQGIDGLSEQDKARLPEMDLTDEQHKQAIADVFQHHHPPTGAEGMFEKFYAAQVLWDESMAQYAVGALQQGAERVVVLAGVGHVGGYRGIPNRMKRRLPDLSMLTIVPVTLDEDDDAQVVAQEGIDEQIADILVLVEPRDAVSI